MKIDKRKLEEAWNAVNYLNNKEETGYSDDFEFKEIEVPMGLSGLSSFPTLEMFKLQNMELTVGIIFWHDKLNKHCIVTSVDVKSIDKLSDELQKEIETNNIKGIMQIRYDTWGGTMKSDYEITFSNIPFYETNGWDGRKFYYKATYFDKEFKKHAELKLNNGELLFYLIDEKGEEWWINQIDGIIFSKDTKEKIFYFTPYANLSNPNDQKESIK